MSRRDIAVILERLSLDHRTSLAEKACAFLQAVESNSSVRNHPSHAAICVNIAADQLSIEISRPALVRFSGAASPASYSSTLQSLSRILAGESTQPTDDTPNLDMASINSSHHTRIQQMISSTSQKYLRQLAVQYGSMELVGLVLECLDQFFEALTDSLPPAQRAYVNYSHAKWIGAAFWLCAMARGMTVGKDESQEAAKAKKIGGRGGKELKDMVLAAVEHKVKKLELDNTIRLIEKSSAKYLLSLRKSKTGASSAPSTPRKRKSSNNSDNSSSTTDIVIPMRGGAVASRPASPNGDEEGDGNPFLVNGSTTSSTTSKLGEGSRLSDAYKGLSTKRQISNVSQLSMNSDSDEAGQDNDRQTSVSTVKSSRSTKPPSKRTKSNLQDTSLSSADIMKSAKDAARKGLKELTAASQESTRLMNQRRNAGGVYSMIPRVKYENTKAFAHYQEWRAQILRSLASAG